MGLRIFKDGCCDMKGAGSKYVVCRLSFKYKTHAFWKKMQQWCQSVFPEIWDESPLSKTGTIKQPADKWIDLFDVKF